MASQGNRLSQQKKFPVGDYAKQLLRSKQFVATDGTVYEAVIIMGDELKDDQQTNRDIWVEGAKRGYRKPPAELAPYVREKFSDDELKAMGVWALVVMHEPITGSGGYPNLLGADRDGGGQWLDAYYGDPDSAWSRGLGFVFLRPTSS